MKDQNKLVTLYTPEGEALKSAPRGHIPWDIYPRPRMERGSFLCLNGEWDFSVAAKGEAPSYDEKIIVPFVPESVLSGIGRTMPEGGVLCYRKRFSLPRGFLRGRVILHIGAADQVAKVYLNGKLLGEHTGGYESFSFDLTDALCDENKLEVFVTDDLGSLVLPYGKQCKKRGGMWYTPVSGIWQTVWLESTPMRYITDLSVVSDGEGADVSVVMSDGSLAEGSLVLHLPEGDEVIPFTGGGIRVSVDSPRLWSPEDPFLYRFTVKVGDDSADSYFALRTLTVEERGGFKRLCLNGEPYFFHGLLDQGYYSDGIFLPASPEGYARDIKAAKDLGFNMLRKHIKAEPEIFYYECDRHGIAVFQDMINNGDYSFFRDTALPTVGMKRLNDKSLHKDKKTRAAFLSAMDETVKRLSFHPSVCYWTIFNEGWGQFDHASAYSRLKALDSTRFTDSVSGWFIPPKASELKSDVESFHVYFKPVKLPKAERKPTVLSEFGGYSLKCEGHSFNLVDNYGYRTFQSPEELSNAIEKLYLTEVLPAIKEGGLSASVYTQLTDVEDETNGLLTYDRKVIKVDGETMKAVASALYEASSKVK